MKIKKFSSSQWVIGILWLGVMSSAAESSSNSPAISGERPKFQSKIHIPMKLAKETTTLPPLEKKKSKDSGPKLEDLN